MSHRAHSRLCRCEMCSMALPESNPRCIPFDQMEDVNRNLLPAVDSALHEELYDVDLMAPPSASRVAFYYSNDLAAGTPHRSQANASPCGRQATSGSSESPDVPKATLATSPPPFQSLTSPSQAPKKMRAQRA